MVALCHNSKRRGLQRRKWGNMRKGLRKVKAGILAVLLIIGSLQLTPVTSVRAEETNDASAQSTQIREVERTYTADQLTFKKRWSSDTVEMPYAFEKNYDEIWFQLPEAIDMSRCEKVIFQVADQGGQLCFKIYNSSNESLKDIYNCAGSETYEYVPEFTDKATAIGIMSQDDNATYPFSAEFVSITFVMKVEEIPQDQEITYAAEQLTFTKRWSSETVEMPYAFEKNYDEIWFKLPEAIDMSRCEKVTFRVADQEGQLCFKIYDSSNKSLKDIYNCVGKEAYEYVPEFTDKVTAIGIMSQDDNATYPFSANFISVTFKMTGAAVEEEPLPFWLPPAWAPASTFCGVV